VASLGLRLWVGINRGVGQARRSGSLHRGLIWVEVEWWAGIGGIFPHHLWDMTTWIQPSQDWTGRGSLGMAAVASWVGTAAEAEALEPGAYGEPEHMHEAPL